MNTKADTLCGMLPRADHGRQLGLLELAREIEQALHEKGFEEKEPGDENEW